MTDVAGAGIAVGTALVGSEADIGHQVSRLSYFEWKPPYFYAAKIKNYTGKRADTCQSDCCGGFGATFIQAFYIVFLCIFLVFGFVLQ